MTTDITELAQSEINDALAQLKQVSEYPTPSTQYARVLRKYIASLVEALEKAKQRIDELEQPSFTFEVTAELLTCPRCGRTTTHPEGWHYCHKREGE